MDEVHTPTDVRVLRRRQGGFGLVDSPLRFALFELQAKAVIQPLRSLVVDDHTFVPKNEVNAWASKSRPLRDDFFNTLNDLMIVRGFGDVST